MQLSQDTGSFGFARTGLGVVRDAARRRRTARDDRLLVDVPATDVKRLFRRTVMATWDGHDVRIVGPVDGESLSVESEGGSAWPTSVGLEGDQHEGGHGRARRSELTDLRTVESDITLRGS